MNRGAEIHRPVIKRALKEHFTATGMGNIKPSRAPCRSLVKLALRQTLVVYIHDVIHNMYITYYTYNVQTNYLPDIWLF